MKDVWEGNLTRPPEKWASGHPTQKLEYLLERIILAPTKRGDVALDPSRGSGTTRVVPGKYGRQFIGIDNNKEYLDIAKRRLDQTQEALEW